jgi:hypothetical protein
VTFNKLKRGQIYYSKYGPNVFIILDVNKKEKLFSYSWIGYYGSLTVGFHDVIESKSWLLLTQGFEE